MPIPMTSSRYEQSLTSSPSMYSTPSRSSHFKSAPSTTSYSPTLTSNGQTKLNVVTRIAIEGKAKQGQDGASVKMFLKICVPVDSVTPGSTIPLFPEENVKIHTSQVHPLDHNSVPYNFSSTVSPQLHNAARALNLPPRAQDSFASAFGLGKANGTNGHSSMSRTFKTDDEDDGIPPVDVQYTGHIIVSGYNIAFVLPKVFMSRRGTGSETEDIPVRHHAASRRRPSIGEKNQAHFMAAIDMWVPFMSRPPRSPYLLTIPTPRCLHNQIKLRIFPPANAATSFASLSSIEEDNTVWDLASEPSVTRTTNRPSRTHSYTHFADDESSDTSTMGSSSEGCVLNGTFPSAEHIRIRWAKPIKNLNIAGEENGRRRVGVEVAKGDMTCVVRGKGASPTNPGVQGVLMDVEYNAQCKGVWFPGVATLLGLDVGLEAKGSDIVWPKGFPTQWEVSGSSGYTGFDNGTVAPATEPASRTSSMDSNVGQSHETSTGNESVPFLSARAASSSTASLLRAPLPAQNVADYSFEGSHAALPSGSETLSSISSLPTSSTPLLGEPRLPGHPVTLHLNMNELQPAGKNTFQFRISGTILITAKPTLARINGQNSSVINDGTSDPEPINLPRFTVLAADKETTAVVVRSEAESASVEVFHPTGDIYNDPQARKTVLQKGGFTRCGEDGGRIAIKTLDAFNMATNAQSRPARPRTPSANRNVSSSQIKLSQLPPRNKMAVPAILPFVDVSVTALATGANMFPSGYAVRVCLQTPALAESEWLDFGLAYDGQQLHPASEKSERAQPSVHMICAALDGVPVKAETVKVNKKEAAAIPFEDLAVKDWLSWGKVYTGGAPGRSMVIDYIVKQGDAGIQGQPVPAPVDLLEMSFVLPAFFISIARLEVKVDVMPGLEIASLHSNFDYHHADIKGNRLLRYSLEAFSQPKLRLLLRRKAVKPEVSIHGFRNYFFYTWIVLFIALCSLYRMHTDTQQLRQILDGAYGPHDISTVTVTTTIFSHVMQQKPTQEPCSPTPPLAVHTSAAVFEVKRDISSTTSTVMPTSSISTIQWPTSSTTTEKDPVQTKTETEHHHHIANDSELAVDIPHRRSLLERFGLIPVHQFLFFEWVKAKDTPVKWSLGKVVDAADVVWNICRKVYHYPLDPP